MKKILFIFASILLFSFQEDDKLVKAVEINLIGQYNDSIALSSLKGKYVLIDFWASWCGPCRRENPNVVNSYLEYKDKKFINGKGFEVFSVSLDRDENQWKAAIKADGLLWTSHVWDKSGTASKAYNVQFIPSTFLVDGKGNIVAQGQELRGEGLQSTLDRFLKKKKKKSKK